MPIDMDALYKELFDIIGGTELGGKLLEDLQSKNEEIKQLKEDKQSVQEQVDNLTLTILTLQSGGAK